MQKIIIKNFGPIKDVELDVNDFMIFIGPQASGKSTISKAIYFFKSIRIELTKHMFKAINRRWLNIDIPTRNLTRKFINFWGHTTYFKNYYLEYNCGNDIIIKITLNDKYPNFQFNDKFKSEFKENVQKIKNFNIKTQVSQITSSSEEIRIESERQKIINDIEKEIKNLFNDRKEDFIFLPAGRSFLATLVEQQHNIRPFMLDYLTREFLYRVNNSKSLFSRSISDIVIEKEKLSQQKIDFNAVNLAQKSMENILKASYKKDTDTEKLYYGSQGYTNLNYSSSGQQESLWILLLIFLAILNNKETFIVVEEPESHLYPEAQKEVLELIALLSNMRNNQVIITTHSPYILSALNNLLYAFNLGQAKQIEAEKIINKNLWVNPDRISAFFISNGTLEDILDKEVRLIKAEAIDSASRLINSTFSELFSLDE